MLQRGATTPAARSAAGAVARLKINYALMRTTELKMLWKMVKSGEKRKLSAADLALLWRIRLALREYESKIEAEQRQCKNE
jgi:hypothetical protein